MEPAQRILCDFEFHFTSGELLCVTAEEGRDTVQETGTVIVLTVRPEPTVTVELEVSRQKLNALQRTTRTVEPASTIEDAGRIKVVGAL